MRTTSRTLQTLGHEVAFALPATCSRLCCATRLTPVMPRPSGQRPSNPTSRPCCQERAATSLPDTAPHARSAHEEVRIMQTNALRGLLYEFGIVLPEGHRALPARAGRTGKAQEQAARSGGRQHSGSTASYRQPAVRYRPAGQTLASMVKQTSTCWHRCKPYRASVR